MTVHDKRATITTQRTRDTSAEPSVYERKRVDMIDNTEDMIDSRDIIERLAELDPFDDDAPLTEEEAAERASLLALADQAVDYAEDWLYGVTLIRDSYFKEYAMELADDIGAIEASASWPYTCIDWEQAARELRMDYTAVDFDGVTYWVR